MVLRIRALLIALGIEVAALSACDTPTTAPEQVPPVVVDETPDAWTTAEVEADLARLRALDVVEIGALLAVDPSAASNCYVCPDPGDPATWNAKAADLNRLATVAQAAVDGPLSGACDDTRVAGDLDALARLDIVEVGALLTTLPEHLQNCYCSVEVQAFRCDRLDKLAAIADAARAAFDLPEPTAPDAAAIAAAVAAKDSNLETLAALEIVAVGALVLDVPAEAFHCYGPCPGWEDAIAVAEGAAALRLADLTERAVATTTGAAIEGACAEAAIDANVRALDDLAIVEVGTFLAAEPANNPACYSLPCASDIEAAAALTCERAQHLARLVDATRGL